MGKSQPCLFLDRDGTINVEKEFIADPAELTLIPNTIYALKEARILGLKIIVVSNQSGIARGFLTEDDVKRVNKRLKELLGRGNSSVDAIYYCPHYYVSKPECNCRKPKTGMFLRAKEEHNVDLNRSIMVGDRMSDMEAGKNIGAVTFLVETGYGKMTCREFTEKPDEIDYIVPTLYHGMNKIKQIAEDFT